MVVDDNRMPRTHDGAVAMIADDVLSDHKACFKMMLAGREPRHPKQYCKRTFMGRAGLAKLVKFLPSG